MISDNFSKILVLAEELNTPKPSPSKGEVKPYRPLIIPFKVNHYQLEKLGQTIGIDPNHISICLESFFNSPTPTAIKLFEQFLIAAKMQSSDALTVYSEKQTISANSFQRAQEKQWQNTSKTYIRWAKNQRANQQKIRNTWEEFVNDLRVKHQKHKDITYWDADDVRFLKHLSDLSPSIVWLDGNQITVFNDFAMSRFATKNIIDCVQSFVERNANGLK